MIKLGEIVLILLMCGMSISLSAQRHVKNERQKVRKSVPLSVIRLSDPFIVADKKSMTYYMTGTGGRLWKSKDLKYWTGPFDVVKQDTDSWMGAHPQIWAAEIHEYKGKYYYFATFTNHNIIIDTVKGQPIYRRASQILVSNHPDGPYVSFGKNKDLPANESTLDATFWVEDGQPYMIYCHEWIQNWNGTVEKIALKPDLSGTVGGRDILFFASESPWSKEKIGDRVLPNRVTDGPYVFRTKTGHLGMIWTSWVFDKYTQGVAYSDNGRLDGNWIQEKEPVTLPNYGHGMLFQTFEGQWLMCLHSHKKINGRTIRIPHLFHVDLSGDKLKVGKPYIP